MKKLMIALLVCLMTIGCLSGCKKEVPEPEPIKVEPITIEDLKGKIAERDEALKDLKGTYTIVSNNTQDDKSETKIKFVGENDNETYEAEYVLKSTFKEGAWVVDSFETVSSNKTPKNLTPPPTEPDPSVDPTPQGPNGADENDTTKYAQMVKEYYEAQYDGGATVTDCRYENGQITAKVECEDRYKYISDVYNYTSVFKLVNGKLQVVSEKKSGPTTISNFEGKYYQVNYTGKLSGSKTPYIEFTRDWQWKMYVISPDGFFGDDWVIGSGSYSISNTTLTMKPKNGWKYNGYLINGGSETLIVPSNLSMEFINFTITVLSVNEVKLGANAGTSASGSHFKKK